jgi:Fe-S cluster biogenesis protein NfuA
MDRSRSRSSVRRTLVVGSPSVVSASREAVVRVCSEILAPLIRQDGGELYLVAVEQDRLSLHLAGRCSGCPGTTFTCVSIIEPAVHAVAPSIRITITSGFRIPEGATIVG